MKKKTRKTINRVLYFCIKVALLALLITLTLNALFSCTAPAPVVYYDQYQTGGCYTIEDTTINEQTYLIGTK